MGVDFFVACLVCGREAPIAVAAALASSVWAPSGWISVLAVHWPAGVELGPLPLRICPRCLVAALTKPAGL